MKYLIIFATLLITSCSLKRSERGPSSAVVSDAQIQAYDWKKERADEGGPQDFDSFIAGAKSDKIQASLIFYYEKALRLYLFHGDEYTRVNWEKKSVDPGFPRKIKDGWRGVFSDGVDAVFAHPYQGRDKFYFFKGKQYIRYDVKDDKADKGYPKPIKGNWSGIWEDGVDDALSVEKGVVYFFKGDQYVRYNFDKDRVEKGYPRAIDADTWDGIWPSGIDSAFYDEALKKVWFIKYKNLKRPKLFDENVIFLTLDGVRYQEFFSGKTDRELSQGKDEKLFPLLWSKNANKGVVFGDPFQGNSMRVANNVGISYPAYLTMFNGSFNRQCESNHHVPSCPKNWLETFPERLIREKSIARDQVAVFASWDRIEDAVWSGKEKFVVNAGLYEYTDPQFPKAHDQVNQLQRTMFGPHPAKREERPDNLTWQHAMIYLKNHKPKFMYIYLLDTDTAGHQGRYDRYTHFINQSDKWIDELLTTLSKMGEYGKKTTLVISTDHGRGVGREWANHGSSLSAASFESSKKVWAVIIGPHTPAKGLIKHPPYSHINLRPTMERLLGLRPYLGDDNMMKEAFFE